jgi:hypothetical protein
VRKLDLARRVPIGFAEMRPRAPGEDVDVPAALGQAVGELAHQHLRAADHLVAESHGHEREPALTTLPVHAVSVREVGRCRAGASRRDG